MSRPSRFLQTDDFCHAGIHRTGDGEQIILLNIHSLHRVFAGGELHARASQCGDPFGERRVGLYHQADAFAVGDDANFCDVDTERSLNIFNVVQHRFPGLRVGACHLEHDSVRDTVLRPDRHPQYAFATSTATRLRTTRP